MCDIWESNLFNPSSPREIYISTKSRLRNEITVNKIKHKKEKDSNSPHKTSALLQRLLDHVDSYLNPYVVLEEKIEAQITIKEPSSKKKNVKEAKNKFWIRDKTMAYPQVKDFLNSKFKTWAQFVLNLRDAFQEKSPDEERLLLKDKNFSDTTKGVKKSPKRKMKQILKRRKLVCSNMISNSRRVISTKRKQTSKRVKKSCRNWAYGVGSTTSFLYPNFFPSHHGSSRHYQLDFSYVSNEPTRIFY